MSPATASTPSASSLKAPDSQRGYSSGESIVSDVPQTPGVENDGVLLSGISHLTVNDEESIKVKSDLSGSYSINIAGSKDSKGYSPSTERYSPPFIRNGRQTRGDDPFQSSPRSQRIGSGQHTPKGKTIRKALSSDNWRSSSSSGDESVPSSPSHAKAERNSKRGDKKSYQQESSLYVQEHVSSSPDSKLTGYATIKAEDAQSVYPPSCCVFVANLLQTENEETLEMAVTQVFREFGPVFVKIRRDGKHMPFAFCQYTNERDAERAIRDGKGHMILSRPCRTEKAKAHRLFFVERKYGAVVTPEEVRELLNKFGAIEHCYTASHVERTALNLNEGVIVQFKMYDEGQDALNAFRNHHLYKVQSIQGLASPNHNIRSPPSLQARSYLARYEVDRRSIFVGNLPLGVTESQLTHLFEHYGHIEEIIIRESASKYEPHDRFCFAFVEFRSPIAVSNAIIAKNGFTFGGKILRVLQKDSEIGGVKPRTNRVTSSASTAPADSYQSPVAHPVQQQATPMSQVPPPAYGYSPYGAYPYGSPYYAYVPGGAVIADLYGHYYGAPYSSPSHYTYPTSPSYDSQSQGHSELAGSPAAQTSAYSQLYAAQYAGYPTAPYWPMTSSPTTQQQGSSPVTYYPPVYSPPLASSTVTEDRSATPTPPGPTSTDESPLESQQ